MFVQHFAQNIFLLNWPFSRYSQKTEVRLARNYKNLKYVMRRSDIPHLMLCQIWKNATTIHKILVWWRRTWWHHNLKFLKSYLKYGSSDCLIYILLSRPFLPQQRGLQQNALQVILQTISERTTSVCWLLLFSGSIIYKL